MNLHDRARAITAESLNGGGWTRPEPTPATIPTDDKVTGRRRLRELMDAAADLPDDTEKEAG